ncbi:TPA: efflux RND transporter permease subunit, partial [Shigella sonnei]
MCPGIGASIKNSLLRYKNRPCRERKHRSGGEKQKGSRGIRRGQGYRLVFQFPIRERYNGLPSMEIQGEAAPGTSSGDAMALMENLASKLPAGIGYDWTGMSYQ